MFQKSLQWSLFILGMVLVLLPSTSDSQITAERVRIDPLTFLRQVSERYANATSYRVEAVKEEEFDGEFSKDWSQSFIKAVVGPEEKYRFEVRSRWEWWIQVSDGKVERTYSPLFQQYVEKPRSASGPTRFVSSSSVPFAKLTEAQYTSTQLSEVSGSLRTATYLPDEALSIKGELVDCNVIKGEGRYRPGQRPDTKSEATFWIDKQQHLIRKVRTRLEGSLLVGSPQEHDIEETTSLYTVSVLDPVSLPDSLFVLNPPSSAKLVNEFSRSLRSFSNTLLGNPAPEVILHAPEGSVPITSFRGKPVLLDFWATWCAPCVESMPNLEKLYSERSTKGLVMLSIDEDDDPVKASTFLAEHKEPWPNFHDDGEVARLFPNQGIPHFVLIDSNGTVVYSKSSFDESELRAAISKLIP